MRTDQKAQKSRRLFTSTLLTLSIFLCALAQFQPKAFGQAEQGTITGAVKDASGAMASGAKVTATNTATNFVSTTVSDASAYYTIPYLAPGTYNVSAEATGFSTTTVSNAHITVNLSTAINFT